MQPPQPRFRPQNNHDATKQAYRLSVAIPYAFLLLKISWGSGGKARVARFVSDPGGGAPPPPPPPRSPQRKRRRN
jgi:hypothetical protein